MTPAQRKIHRFTWLIFAILLPLLFVASVWVLPKEFYPSKNIPEGVTAFPEVVQSKDSQAFLFNIRENKVSHKQVEILVKQPLSTAAALVYISPKETNIEKSKLLGQLSSKGVFRFNLDSLYSQLNTFNISIYDPVNESVIQNIAIDSQ